MAFPVRTVDKPAVLAGQVNGKLDPAILVATPGQAGGPVVLLVEPAGRAWRALCAAALAAGFVLKATSASDSYRSYDNQDRIFLARFTTVRPAGSTIMRSWHGKTWWLKPGCALAAIPGTSNHGLALAVDTGEELDGDAGTEHLDDATLAWLLAHELDYGWSHEVQSEPWHLRYFTGDAIPAAVLAYEAGTHHDPHPNPEAPPVVPDQEANPMLLFKAPGGSICLLAHGKIVVIHGPNPTEEQDQQLLLLMAGLPIEARNIIPIRDGEFWHRLTVAYPVVGP